MNNELIVSIDPKSTTAEAFKTIRTNLQFSSVDEKVKSILITSSTPGEGKSFISSNLAIAFAQAGSKVLLIDCDLRRGRVHRVFDVDNEKGLSNLLIDNVKENYKDYIQKTSFKGLSVIPRGAIPPNPSELLGSSKAKELAKLVAKGYDMVIYDGVPLMGLADSVLMADLVDKIVLVSTYKQTRLEELENSKRVLEIFEGKLAGVIFNKLPQRKSRYYYSYYK